MAQSTIGSVGAYDGEEHWDTYAERVQLFLTANNVADDREVASFLSVIGAQVYGILKNACSPEVPAAKQLDQCIALLRQHYAPKPLVIVEHFRFMKYKQRESETVSMYVNELQRLSKDCEFGDTLAERLRDQLVVGLKSESMQKRLLSEKDLTFQKAVDISTTMETASKDTKELSQGSTNPHRSPTVSKINSYPTSTGGKLSAGDNISCYRCGSNFHKANKCDHVNTQCNHCSKIGHLAKVCRSAATASASKSKQRYTHFKKQNAKKPVPVKYVLKSGNESYVSDAGPHPGYSIFSSTTSNNGKQPYVVRILLNGISSAMEIDTGASLSLISEEMYKSKFPSVPLQPSSTLLRTYTQEQIHVLGEIYVFAQYRNQSANLKLQVVKGAGPMLLGRDWLAFLKLQWNEIHQAYTDKLLNLDKYGLFGDTLGTMKGVTATINLKGGATPKYFKPRPVAYAMRDKISVELKRLEDSGVLEKVEYSEWATPVVPVEKPDGTIRICGDYKVTVNPLVKVPEYPMPSPEDLFNQLNGGKKFTKLDLSGAYQQIILDDKSREYVTINTHQGLYHYTRLPFGVSCAPAIFQQAMDKILQGLQGIVNWFDDLIVTGNDDDDHIRNLVKVLQRLEDYGVKLKRPKCVFMKDSVEYIGFTLDAQGIHPTPKKVEAMVNAPEPKNVTELKSWLGLVSYYRRFLPNMSTLTAPMNKLLVKNVEFLWSKECGDSFRELKSMFSSSKLLLHYDPTQELTLANDASPYGLGSVISHGDHPIAYASRTLMSAERNYSQIEKEGLAIIFGIQKFHKYLYGRKFILYTDHKPLTYIFHPNRGIPVMAAARL